MKLQEILGKVVSDNAIHARFLNTLSLMENTGARKISASEHKRKVSYIVLKHAAEEARHAFYLKKQIQKVAQIDDYATYDDEFLIAPFASYSYLNLLDLQVCKYLKATLQLSGVELKYAAYLLVTYAIEVRADELYPVYQEVLEQAKSKVNMKSIIVEEEGHLAEMITQLKEFSSNWEEHASVACQLEGKLFNQWIETVGQSIN
ncbi:hypothetical protein QM480_05410 [Flectobacillus sp. DC10W]|jgi:hypothetical protein|uniref:Rubrerythrin n=1 Tax=Flectobacillus longus TaxID=2984207 RepID=A0ABT6YJJ2_9BACT|nr:hypothetical protein [Flectobacillus longus]MDI9863750.1 hypothetical protein [Flectobacillus longus]